VVGAAGAPTMSSAAPFRRRVRRSPSWAAALSVGLDVGAPPPAAFVAAPTAVPSGGGGYAGVTPVLGGARRVAVCPAVRPVFPRIWCVAGGAAAASAGGIHLTGAAAGSPTAVEMVRRRLLPLAMMVGRESPSSDGERPGEGRRPAGEPEGALPATAANQQAVLSTGAAVDGEGLGTDGAAASAAAADASTDDTPMQRKTPPGREGKVGLVSAPLLVHHRARTVCFQPGGPCTYEFRSPCLPLLLPNTWLYVFRLSLWLCPLIVCAFLRPFCLGFSPGSCSLLQLSVTLLSSTHANVRCDLIQKLVTSMGDQHVVVLTLGAGGCRAPEPDLEAFVIPAVPQVVTPPAGLEAEGDTQPADALANASPDASTTPGDDEEGEDGDDDADMLDVEDAASAEAAAQLRAAAARAAQADAATAGETTAPSLTTPPSASSVSAPLTEPPTPEEGVVCPNYDWVSVGDVPSLVSTLQSLAADRTVDYVLVDGGRAEGTSTEPHILARTLVEQCGRVVAIDALVVALDGAQALGDLYAPHSDAEAAAAAAAAVEAETSALDAGAGLQDDVSRAMRFVKLVEHANVIVVVGEATTAGGGEVGAGFGTAPAVEDRPASGRESLTQQLAVVLTALNAEARVVHTLGPTVNPGALVRTGLYGSSGGLLPMWKRILAACDGEGRPLSAVVGADGRPGESSSGKGSSAAESGGRAGAIGKNGRGSNGVTTGTVVVRANGGGEEASGTVVRPALPRAAREATFVFRAKRPFHPARLYDQIKVMTTFAGVLRSTGKLWLATRMAKPLEWNQAGDTATVRLGRPFLASVPEELWREEDRAALADVRWDERWGDRETVLVFVGVRMDKAKLQGLLDSCLLQDEEMVFDHAWQSLSDPFVQWVPLSTDDDEDEEDEDEDDEDLGSSAPAQPEDGPPETFSLQPAVETYSLQPTDGSAAGAAGATSTTAAVAAASMATAAMEEPRSASGEIAAATELAASVATEPAAAAAAPLVDPGPTIETVPLVQTAPPVDAPPPPSPVSPAAAEVAAAESADAAQATGVAEPGDGAAAPAGKVAVNGVAANAVATPADMTEPPARPDATLTTVTEPAPGGAPAPAVPNSPVAGPAVEGAVPATSGDAPLNETAWEAEWAAQEEGTATAPSASTAGPPTPSSAAAPAQAPVEPPPPPPPLPTPPPRPPPRQPPQAAAAPPVAPPAPPPEPTNYSPPSPSPPPGSSPETPPPTDCGGS